MNILLVTDSYPPEIRSASTLMEELATSLRSRGHAVTVVTSYPRYNLAREGADRKYDECETRGGVRVVRVRTLPHHKVNFLVRGIAQLTLPWKYRRAVLRHASGGYAFVIVYSPPLPLAGLGRWAQRRFRARFILNVQDLFPQNAIDLGVLTNPLLISFFRAMERRAYRAADAVTVHSEGNRRFLLATQSGVAPDKVTVLHNWIDLEPFRGVPPAAETFRCRWGLEGKLVFLFAGVIGPAQGLEFLLEAVDRLRDIPDLVFLIVGDGMERTRLEARAADRGLRQIVFKDFVGPEDYARLVREVDVGLVCLSARNRTPVVPGKILGYMAAAKPVVALLNRDSDGHAIIRDADCGITCVSDDVEVAAGMLRRMVEHRGSFAQWGRNAFRYVTANFEKDLCLDRLEKLFDRKENDRER